MQWFTFNKIYAAMIVLAIVSALVLPKTVSDRTRAQIQSVFAPISGPVRIAAAFVHGRVAPREVDTESVPGASRSYQQIADENQALRLEFVHLSEQFRKLQQINADRQALGALRESCRPMRVSGTDSSLRRSLLLSGSVEGLKPGMAVLYGGGLAGRLDRVGWSGGASVQLITDGAFRITARFGRLATKDGQPSFTPLGETTTLLEGDNARAMATRTITMKDAEQIGVQAGDWAVIADDDYPEVLQGYRIGHVVSVKPARAPGFAEILVKPVGNLSALTEVMVLEK